MARRPRSAEELAGGGALRAAGVVVEDVAAREADELLDAVLHRHHLEHLLPLLPPLLRRHPRRLLAPLEHARTAPPPVGAAVDLGRRPLGREPRVPPQHVVALDVDPERARLVRELLLAVAALGVGACNSRSGSRSDSSSGSLLLLAATPSSSSSSDDGIPCASWRSRPSRRATGALGASQPPTGSRAPRRARSTASGPAAARRAARQTRRAAATGAARTPRGAARAAAVPRTTVASLRWPLSSFRCATRR